MPIKVKDPGAAATKWVSKATNAQADYKAGVMAPKQDQNAAAIASADLWQTSVSSTAAKNAFTSGLRTAGLQGWQTGATVKGAAHYPDGVRAAQTKYQTNVTPFLQAIAGLTLPAKGIRGSDSNIARVTAVAQALHALRLQRRGGG